MPRSPGYSSYSPSLDGSEVTPDELEFLLAMHAFQRRTGRRYPTWREVLHVARCLGYRKVAEPTAIDAPKPPPPDDPFEIRHTDPLPAEAGKFEIRNSKEGPESGAA